MIVLLSRRDGLGAEPRTGDSVLRGPALGSEIVLTTTSRLAGAIHSLRWNGKEFIDSADHGRQLQSASSFDAGSPFTPETFNPTEAGSRHDGAGPTSTSRLLAFSAERNRLKTTNQMAFWLRPGEDSSGNLAKNTTNLSNHRLSKSVTIGALGMENVLAYDVTFFVPPGEPHRYAQFEALTGYMPAEFSEFFVVNLANGKRLPLSDGPGEQALPIIFSTADGAHAMGCFTREPNPGYGRFRFRREKVVKWNIVFRKTDKREIPAGDYTYRMFVIVGPLTTVTTDLIKLANQN